MLISSSGSHAILSNVQMLYQCISKPWSIALHIYLLVEPVDINLNSFEVSGYICTALEANHFLGAT